MNNKSKFDVLLTNGWDRISYNVLRSLVKNGLSVAFGVDKFSGMGVYSNLKHNNFVYTSYKESEIEFINDILNFIKSNDVSVYIPTGEEAIIIAKHIHKFKKLNTKLLISCYETLTRLNNKAEAYHLANSLKIPTPESILPNSFEDIKNFSKKVGYPIVFKTLCSNSSKGVFFLNETRLEESIIKLLQKKSLNFGDFMIQQFVRGEGYGVSMLVKEGNVVAAFTHKRLREKINTGGPSTLRISTKNDVLEKNAEIFLKSQNFNGVAMVEFKFNELEQKDWFIEVNPRFWGSVGLAINSGVDFPKLLYDLAMDQELSSSTKYSLGIRYKWLLGDLYINLKNFFQSFNFNYIKNIFEKVDGFDDYYPDDKRPFFMFMFLFFRRFFLGIIRLDKK